MASRKMYRTSRSEYVGCDVRSEALQVHFQTQVMQGPAGWQDIGNRGSVYVPLSRLLYGDITDSLDKIVRRELNGIWDPTKGTEPLF